MSEHDSGSGSSRKGFVRDVMRRIAPSGQREEDADPTASRCLVCAILCSERISTISEGRATVRRPRAVLGGLNVSPFRVCSSD